MRNAVAGGSGGGAGQFRGMAQAMAPSFGGGYGAPGTGGFGTGFDVPGLGPGGVPSIGSGGGGAGGIGELLGGGMTPPILGGTTPGMNPTDPLGAFGKQLTNWADNASLTPKNAVEALDKIGGLAQDQYNATSGVNKTLDQAGNSYVGGLGQATGDFSGQIGDTTQGYQKTQKGLAQTAADSGSDLKSHYTKQNQAIGTLQDQAMGNAANAMSLQDAGDVNNKVQTSTRNLYNQEGDAQNADYQAEGANRNAAYQAEGSNRRNAYNDEGNTQEQAYENKAQGIGKEGLAASGMLAALGGQAMAGQLGGASPMTGGQLAAMQGANMSRAGQAYGRAQQQMQNMRNQGMDRKMDQRNQGLGTETQMRGQGLNTETASRGQGLSNKSAMRAQGVNQGFAQSDAQYNRGQGAVGTAAGLVGQNTSMQNAYQGLQQGLRNEESGYGGNIYNAGMTQAGQNFGAQQGLLGAQLGNAQDQGARQTANIQGLYQPQMAAAGQTANIYGQYGAGMMGMVGDLANAGAYMYGQTARAVGDAAPF